MYVVAPSSSSSSGSEASEYATEHFTHKFSPFDMGGDNVLRTQQCARFPIGIAHSWSAMARTLCECERDCRAKWRVGWHMKLALHAYSWCPPGALFLMLMQLVRVGFLYRQRRQSLTQHDADFARVEGPLLVVRLSIGAASNVTCRR